MLFMKSFWCTYIIYNYLIVVFSFYTKYIFISAIYQLLAVA